MIDFEKYKSLNGVDLGLYIYEESQRGGEDLFIDKVTRNLNNLDNNHIAEALNYAACLKSNKAADFIVEFVNDQNLWFYARSALDALKINGVQIRDLDLVPEEQLSPAPPRTKRQRQRLKKYGKPYAGQSLQR